MHTTFFEPIDNLLQLRRRVIDALRAYTRFDCVYATYIYGAGFVYARYSLPIIRVITLLTHPVWLECNFRLQERDLSLKQL